MEKKTVTKTTANIMKAPKAEKNKNKLQYFAESGPNRSFILYVFMIKKISKFD
jgi:hypothetical protein